MQSAGQPNHYMPARQGHQRNGPPNEERGRGRGRGRAQNDPRSQQQGPGNRPRDQYTDQLHGASGQQYYSQGRGYDQRGRVSSSGGYDVSYNKFDRDEDPSFFLSKTLSFLLRHGAEKQGFKFQPGGFLYVDEILYYVRKLNGFTEEDVVRVVETNDKKRFALKQDESGRLMIRANQGHTIQVEDLDLTPITSADQVDHVIHGTYLKSWEIIKTEGLCTMGRNHIHFAVGEPEQNGVISGMRKTCEVVIYLDVAKALAAGIKFFRSENNVILSPGNEKGYIFPCFFGTVLQRYPRMRLEFDATISSNSSDGPKQKKDKKKERKEKNKKEGKRPDEREIEERRQAKRLKKPAQEVKDVEMEDLTTLNETETSESLMTSDLSVEQTTQDIQDKLDMTGKSKSPETDKETTKQSTPDSKAITQATAKSDPAPMNPSASDQDLNTEGEAKARVSASRKPDKKAEIQIAPTIVSSKDEADSMLQKIHRLKPHLISITCSGSGLGEKNGKIVYLAVTSDRFQYVLSFPENDSIAEMTECLKSILDTKETDFLLYDVEKVAIPLLDRHDILLSRSSIIDVKVMVSLLEEKLDDDKLDEFNMMEFSPKSWARQLKVMKSDREKVTRKLITQGLELLDVYNIFKTLYEGVDKKQVRKETYASATFKDEKHWLHQKFTELYEGTKSKKEDKEKRKSEESGGSRCESKGENVPSKKKKKPKKK